MNIVIFGASGMIGHGVLQAALDAADVEKVVAVLRAPPAQRHPKLETVIVPDMLDLSAVEDRLTGLDACFFCLGISSVGMDEARYTRITYDITMEAASVLLRWNANLSFVFISGQGTDSTEKGRTMWARVKGRAENALLHLPFRAAYMFRPGAVIPMQGATSKTRLYQVLYTVFMPLWLLLHALLPRHVLTTKMIGQGMLEAVRRGAPSGVYAPPAIYALATGHS